MNRRNMLDFTIWMNFIYTEVIGEDDPILNREVNVNNFIGVNSMCYVITSLIKEVLSKYCRMSHIPKDYHYKINMKNEFLFERMILTNKKKRYMAKVLLREGKDDRKIDIKGLDFMKSTTNKATKKYFKELATQYILEPEEINIADVVRGAYAFKDVIKNSLIKGDKDFLSPKNVKEPGAYEKPLSEQGIRGVIAWNYVYPDMEITLPVKLDIVKTNIMCEEDIEGLKDTYPDIYRRLMNGIFRNSNPDIVKKGVEIFAIPRSIDAVPEWLIPYINYDAIVNENLTKFHPILKSLGIEMIKTSSEAGKTYFSNIIDFQ